MYTAYTVYVSTARSTEIYSRALGKAISHWTEWKETALMATRDISNVTIWLLPIFSFFLSSLLCNKNTHTHTEKGHLNRAKSSKKVLKGGLNRRSSRITRSFTLCCSEVYFTRDGRLNIKLRFSWFVIQFFFPSVYLFFFFLLFLSSWLGKGQVLSPNWNTKKKKKKMEARGPHRPNSSWKVSGAPHRRQYKQRLACNTFPHLLSFAPPPLFFLTASTRCCIIMQTARQEREMRKSGTVSAFHVIFSLSFYRMRLFKRLKPYT